MAKINFKDCFLKDIFLYKNGNSEYTKTFCELNKGNYEVFTGSTLEKFGSIKSFDYEGELLTFSTDGEYAGTLSILNGKFNVGGHRMILFPKVENLVLNYFKYVLQKQFFNKVKAGDVPSLKWDNIKELKVKIPVDELGNFDINMQEEIVNKYQMLEDKKRELENRIDYIKKVEIDFLYNELKNIKFIKLGELFDLSISTNKSWFTKTFINSNKGNIPVYGTSKDKKNVNYGFVEDNLEASIKGKIEKVKYFENCLTWNIDGSIGLFYREGRFSLSEKVIPLILKEEYKNIIDNDFLKYIILIQIKKMGFKFSNKMGKGKIKEIDLPIPIDKNENFDLEKQKEIARKNLSIISIKNDIIENLKKIIEQEVQITNPQN